MAVLARELILDWGGLDKGDSPPNSRGRSTWGQISVIKVQKMLASLPCILGRKVSLMAITKDFSSARSFISEEMPSPCGAVAAGALSFFTERKFINVQIFDIVLTD